MISSKKVTAEQSQISNRILFGTELIGDIKTNGDIRVDGVIKGTVQTEGKLVIGEKGLVEGQVHCSNATLSGLLKGTIHVAELLTLHNSAKINGDIFTGKLMVEPGAEFTGKCNMGAVVRDLKSNEEGKQQKSKSEKTA